MNGNYKNYGIRNINKRFFKLVSNDHTLKTIAIFIAGSNGRDQELIETPKFYNNTYLFIPLIDFKDNRLRSAFVANSI